MSTLAETKCPRCGAALPANAPEGLCPRCLGALNLVTDTVLTGAEATVAQPPLTPAELAPHFPQLDIIECLGRGGMGVVYKARQKSLNRLVALKLLAPERVTDAGFAERFTREAQALAALNHPNIVTIYDFGYTRAGGLEPPSVAQPETPNSKPETAPAGFYFLLMEFVDGVNLRQAMKAGRFTPEQALTIVPPVCEALQYAHEHGIVHRDIKPENLLLDKTGRVKIADFGIAKMLEHGRAELPLGLSNEAAQQRGPTTPESLAAGTPEYMAPEQRSAPQRADHRVDIYSLGVVLYELLTGELPGAKLQPPSRKVQIDVRLDEVVLRALETKPELRYQTAGEFRTQVEAMTSGAGVPPAAPSGAAASSRFSRTAIVGACLSALGLLCIFLSLFGERFGRDNHPAASVGPALFGAGLLYMFATTILGWISVTQIRRSAGKLYGLWLAVFDGLFFPLLMLDALIFSASGSVIYLLLKSSDSGTVPVWLILFLTGVGVFTVALVIWLDFRIVRAVLDALEVKPELRYQTAAELRTQGETIAGSPPPANAARTARLSAPLKSSRCHFTTPEHLATFFGGFWWPTNTGELALQEDRLVFTEGWERTEIPFASLLEVGAARGPRWMSPAGHQFLSLTYTESGQRRQLLLMPGAGWFRTAGDTAQQTVEWIVAIRDAVKAATGRELPRGSGEPVVVAASPWGTLLVSLPPLILGAVGLLYLFARVEVGSSQPARFAPLVILLMLIGPSLAALGGIWRWQRNRHAYASGGASVPGTQRRGVSGCLFAALLLGLVACAAILGVYVLFRRVEAPSPPAPEVPNPAPPALAVPQAEAAPPTASPLTSDIAGGDNSPEAIAKAQQLGIAEATKDIQAGVLRILRYGVLMPTSPDDKDEETGFRIQWVAGSILSSQFQAEADAYNYAMREHWQKHERWKQPAPGNVATKPGTYALPQDVKLIIPSPKEGALEGKLVLNAQLVWGPSYKSKPGQTYDIALSLGLPYAIAWSSDGSILWIACGAANGSDNAARYIRKLTINGPGDVNEQMWDPREKQDFGGLSAELRRVIGAFIAPITNAPPVPSRKF